MENEISLRVLNLREHFDYAEIIFQERFKKMLLDEPSEEIEEESDTIFEDEYF